MLALALAAPLPAAATPNANGAAPYAAAAAPAALPLPVTPPAAPAPPAPPTMAGDFVLLRQDYGLWTHFLLQTPDAVPTGVVERRHWRQVWRRSYELYDTDGARCGHTTQPWLSLGNVFAWDTSMQLHDAAGTALCQLHGALWTLRAATYTLTDPHGQPLADVAVDDRGQSVLFYAPGTLRLVATFLREQQASGGTERWNVHLEAPHLVAAPAWPLLAAFFADVWTQLARTFADY